MQPRLRSRMLLHDVEIRELAELANRFQNALIERKKSLERNGFDWYPYDSFGTLWLLDRVLTGRARWLRTLIGSEPVVDIGCGDGDLAFFLESLGAKVCAVDNPPTNYNRMQGVKALKSALRSPLRIASADLDRNFELP